MPSGDRTGPAGQGPRTGRKLGFCSGYDTPGYSKGFGNGPGRGQGTGRSFGTGLREGRGRGFGRGRGAGLGEGRGYGFGAGRGIGFGRSFNRIDTQAGFYQSDSRTQSMNKEDEIRLIKAQAEALEQTQKDLIKRLSELEKGNDH